MLDKKNIWIFGSIAIVLVLVFGTLILHHKKEINNVSPSPSYKVTYVKVIQGNEFDLKIFDGRRIHGKLPVNTVPESREKVVAYINDCKAHNGSLYVMLLKEEADFWVIDLYVNDGRDSHYSSLSEWLKTQKLLWQKELR